MDDKSYVTHQPIQELIGSNRPLVGPIYQTVKFTADSMKDLAEVFNDNEGRYVYSRVSNPTVRQLEVTLAKLQGCEDGICLSSGVAGISTMFFSLLNQNDHVILFLESYKPSRILVRSILSRFGIKHSIVAIDDLETLEQTIKENGTKILLFESPTNPITRVADVEKITDICKRHKVTSVLDNTFAGFHNHHDYDIDLYIHSLTKFANGHGDTLGGAILGEKQLIKKIRGDFIEFGPCMDANTAFLISRGMKTYFLRYEKQSDNASKLAPWLREQKNVKRVYYPGLEDHPDFELAKKQLKDMGSVIALDIKGTVQKAELFIDSLKLFQLSGSLGSTESLIAPIELFYGNDLSEEEKKSALITSTSVRLAVGIEDIDDLKNDLKNALDKLN